MDSDHGAVSKINVLRKRKNDHDLNLMRLWTIPLVYFSMCGLAFLVDYNM